MIVLKLTGYSQANTIICQEIVFKIIIFKAKAILRSFNNVFISLVLYFFIFNSTLISDLYIL